jgi:Flp pilus assembly protein TadB
MEEMRKAFAAGTLISLACFALVFWAVSRFLPLIPRLAASPWFKGIVVLAVATGPLVCLRKHRRKTNAAPR